MGNNLLNNHKLEIENLYLAVVIFTCPDYTFSFGELYIKKILKWGDMCAHVCKYGGSYI